MSETRAFSTETRACRLGTMHSICVVEDEAAVASRLCLGLKRCGFDVALATDGEAAIELATSREFALILLDLGLPRRSGFDVLKALRNRTRAPIIVLTAQLDLASRMQSFEDGAVDWIGKPFFLEELVVRMRLRLGAATVAAPSSVELGGALLDVGRGTVHCAGVDVGLTRTEHGLLKYLLDRGGRAVTRRQLADEVLAADGDVTDRTVDSHVSRLRKKLGPAGAAITTVWGIGYRLVLPTRQASA
ncbi:MAG: response regulator transcription factor [Myxococcales bacterium]|nr:response regulator transcription factor [Myxococcales bacterium]